jgi:uncharacterized membrane protein YbaN (DUF454 family)
MSCTTQVGPQITLEFDQLTSRAPVETLQRLSGYLREVDGVISVMTRLDRASQKIVVFFNEQISPQTMLRRMAAAIRSPKEPPESVIYSDAREFSSHSSRPTSQRHAIPQHAQKAEAVTVRKTLSQYFYGTLAVASFGMAWVGLLVPGIPTVPFVILTAYLASKASPRFHQRLMESRTFGPMMKDWNEHHAIRPQVRTQAVVATLVIVAISLLIVPPSPTLYAVMAVMFVVSMVVVFSIPVLKEESTDSDHPATVPLKPRSGAPAVA